MEQLTEDILKKVALRFFRHYYKYRLRYEDQPVTAKYDMEGVGGIVADGFYSFKKPDGRDFSATFEATSRASKNEVLFKHQVKVLFWDGLAIAAVATVFLFSLNSLYQFHRLDERELPFRIGLVILSLIGFSGIYQFIARNFRRYRYIYAVEQFKRYHADEQWIALATDVFDHPNDRHFRELKSQCVFNGIGLLMVDKALDPKILITPSRRDIFKGKRNVVPFFSRVTLPAKMQETKYGNWWTTFRSGMPELFQRDKSLQRFRRSYYAQLFVTVLCLSLLGVIFAKEYENKGLDVVKKEEFRDELAKSQSNNVPEQPEYLRDSAEKKTQPKLEAQDKFWKNDTEPASEPLADAKNQTSPAAPADEFTSRGVSDDWVYDCTRYFNFEGKKYIIEAGIYPSFDAAKPRIDQLRKANLEAAAVGLSCFSKKEKGFVVYLGGVFYNSEEEARSTAANLSLEQSMEVHPAISWKIRTLELAK